MADELNLPAIITPTLASTDSPCSALSVIYSEGGGVEGFRFYNRHPLLVLVLVDTQVAARAPKRQLVGGLGRFRSATIISMARKWLSGCSPSWC